MDYFCRLIASMNNAKFALVIVEMGKNQNGHADTNSWENFLANKPRIFQQPKGIETIHENVWQIDLEIGLPVLSELIRWCQAYNTRARVLFLEESPAWLKLPPDAKPDGEV
jgi:hypothetical protein